MDRWGDGARAVVCVEWKKHGSAHAFIVENRNGTVVYIDPQTGNEDCSYYFGYAKDEYEGYEDYINNFGAERSVKQQLLIYAIYNNCGLNDEEAFQQKRAELIEDVIAQQKEAGYDVTEEDIVSYYGESYIRQAMISEMVNDYLYENNEIDWELSSEKQD
jgi:hypothetical protein